MSSEYWIWCFRGVSIYHSKLRHHRNWSRYPIHLIFKLQRSTAIYSTVRVFTQCPERNRTGPFATKTCWDAPHEGRGARMECPGLTLPLRRHELWCCGRTCGWATTPWTQVRRKNTPAITHAFHIQFHFLNSKAVSESGTFRYPKTDGQIHLIPTTKYDVWVGAHHFQ